MVAATTRDNVKMIEKLPGLKVVFNGPPEERLAEVDHQLRNLLSSLLTRDIKSSESIINALLIKLQNGTLERKHTDFVQRWTNEGKSPEQRLALLMRELRINLSQLSQAQVESVDQCFFPTFKMNDPKVTLRSIIDHLRDQYALLDLVYDNATLKNICQGKDSFEEVAVATLCRAIRAGPPDSRYAGWLMNRAGSTPSLADFENMCADEPLSSVPFASTATTRSAGPSASSKPAVRFEDEDEAAPVYAAEARKSGPIAEEVTTALFAQLQPFLKSVQDQCSKLEHQISNLEHEHTILRQCMTTRESDPASFALSTAEPPAQPQPSASRLAKFDSAAIRAAMSSPNRFSKNKTSESKAAKEPAKQREDVDLSQVPEAWLNLIKALQAKHNKSLDDECVVCFREGVTPQSSHSTRQCGLLWTLTKNGCAWLQARREARNKPAMAAAAMSLAQAAAHDPQELEHSICALCDGEPDDCMDMWTEACWTRWDNLDGLVAMLQKQLL